MMALLALIPALGGAGVGYRDKELTCLECKQSIYFTASEQAFYAEQGYALLKRCPSCRAERLRLREQHGCSEGSSALSVTV